MRPPLLVEPHGAQSRVARHRVAQVLGVPVLFELPLVEYVGNSVPAFAEQVIEMPKLALPVCAVQRAALPEPQLVEQLVDVPTVLTYSLLQ